MKVDLAERPLLFTPAKKCSDYDDECIDVIDKCHCYFGDEKLDMADGYCPFMMGMESE